MRQTARRKGMDIHMKKNRGFLRVSTLMAVCAVLIVTVSVAAEPGSAKDPLVTLSYLNETFFNDVMQRVDQKIAARNQQLGGQGVSGSQSANFAVVDLAKGQTLMGGVGCEVMLRIGKAVCVSPSTPGLIDETSGTALNNGSALDQNHMYMMTVEGRGVKAATDTVKVLVRGTYTIA